MDYGPQEGVVRGGEAGVWKKVYLCRPLRNHIMRRRLISAFPVFLVILFLCSCRAERCDVLVVGGGTGGVCAGVQAARLGAETVIVERGPWLGGMLTSAGVGAVDGNYNLRGGIFGEFCDSLAARYGGYEALRSGWVSNIMFEPAVGAEVFRNMAAREPGLKVIYNADFEKVRRRGGRWSVTFVPTVAVSASGFVGGGSGRGVSVGNEVKGSCGEVESVAGEGEGMVEDGGNGVKMSGGCGMKRGRFTVKARVLVDGTELGDLAAAAGADFRLGMDAREDTGEAIAPERANGIVQDLTWVAILRDFGPDADMTVPEPEGYDPSLYADCTRNWSAREMLDYGRLPSGDRYMLNWPDGGNDCYVGAEDCFAIMGNGGNGAGSGSFIPGGGSEVDRERLSEAKRITLGFIRYIQTELGMRNLGIDPDAFPTEDGLALMPYFREARRIRGEVLFTVDDAARPYDSAIPLYKEGIAVGDYAVDHHHKRYTGTDTLPDLHFYPIPSFSVPLRALVPEGLKNFLIADKAMSVSNIINGATRLQPVVMQAGQAAGAAAALAVLSGRAVGELVGAECGALTWDGMPGGIREVQQFILDAGGYLMPYIDLKPGEDGFEAVQKVGACGILRGEGRNVGWTNITEFHINDPVERADLPEDLPEDIAAVCDSILNVADGPISRLEFSILLDREVDLFGTRRSATSLLPPPGADNLQSLRKFLNNFILPSAE